jgi:hypothetical protein
LEWPSGISSDLFRFIVIRHSDDINGFKYKNAEYKLSQYAYEIQIIIDGSEKTPLKLLLIYLMSFQR